MKPLGSRIIAVQEEGKTETQSGILLTSAQTQPPIATIVSVGPGVTTLKKGHRILFSPASVIPVDLDGTRHLIIEEQTVLATLSKSPS